MKFSYNFLQSFFNQKLPAPKQLAKILTLHLAEVEEIKKEKNDWILEIDIRPNRAADCFSHLGIAREISAITNYKLKIENWKLKEYKNLKAKDFVSVEVKEKFACPRYTARVILGVKVAPSPLWLKERLQSCGLRPINNVVDITNYVMLETGQPLHAFDLSKISDKKIIIRMAKKNEKIITLDDEMRNLNEEILIIADSKEPLAIAGIKGGKKTEIDEKTKDIVLESANFNRLLIRHSSQFLNLKTDASVRFDHGLDPNLTEFAINRASALIEKIAEGKVASGLIDFYPKKKFQKKVKLDLEYVKNLLGVDISKKEIIKILENLEFKVAETKGSLLVEIPTFRLDISIQEDLIEEIARIYGYDKIPSVFPITALIPPKKNLDIFWEDITKNILKESGFSEVYNYSFIGEKEFLIFNFPFSKLLEVENPISNEFKYLRPSLIPNLLKNVLKNQKHFKEIKIFELGKIFFKNNKKQFEKRILAGIMTGNVFYETKGIVELLFNKLGISNIWFSELKNYFFKKDSPNAEYKTVLTQDEFLIWHSKKSAQIKIGNENIGFLGEISPKILTALKIEGNICGFEIDFEKLSRLASEEIIYHPPSRFPSAIRDIAVLVPRDVKVEEVLNIIEITGGELLRDIDLFDIYEGEELPEGKKNFAFHLIFQAEDRTLTSKEIEEIKERIIKALEKNPDWEVRK